LFDFIILIINALSNIFSQPYLKYVFFSQIHTLHFAK
jgi:hypothetical protein